MKNRDNVEEKLYKAKHITRLPDSHLLLLTNQNREIWISLKIKTNDGPQSCDICVVSDWPAQASMSENSKF